MYLEMATKDDKKLIEGWKAEAEGIFIFVYYYLLQVLPTLHLIGIDGSILRCCCVVDYSFHSGTSTKSTGHLELLPCQYLSSYNQRRCTRHLEFPPYFPSPILSTRICSLGQCSLALEPGHQSYVCCARKFSAAMGAKIPRGHGATLWSTEASSGPCVLC